MPSPLRSPAIACGQNTVGVVSVVSGVPKTCTKVALVKVFGVRVIGMLSNGVLPSRNMMVPVGLVNACAGLTEPAFAWTVAASPTDPPTMTLAGLAITVVVAPFCP